MSDNNNEKRETVADIVAFISKCLDLLDTELTRMSNKEHALSADALLCPVLNAKAALGRIKAALKRERSKIEADALAVGGIVEAARTAKKSSAVGNAAAMREALENSNGLLEELATIGEWGESAREQIEENNAALSAPARNCDIYNTHDAAMKACHNDRCFCQSPIDERKSVISFMLSDYKQDVKRGEESDRPAKPEKGENGNGTI